jgi:hypothetical protein
MGTRTGRSLARVGAQIGGRALRPPGLDGRRCPGSEAASPSERFVMSSSATLETSRRSEQRVTAKDFDVLDVDIVKDGEAHLD